MRLGTVDQRLKVRANVHGKRRPRSGGGVGSCVARKVEGTERNTRLAGVGVGQRMTAGCFDCESSALLSELSLSLLPS
jgi:hypothetical protein